MMNIGEFARLGGVTTRMLRHYDTLGLLVPAHVDPHTGRRSYDVAQLAVLNRLIALKGLGFRLDEIGPLLSDGVDPAELHGMLRLREAELERQVRQQRHALDRVKARLRLLEQETHMPVETKHVEPITLAALSADALDASRQRTGTVVQALFEQVIQQMEAATADRTTPIARYHPHPTTSQNTGPQTDPGEPVGTGNVGDTAEAANAGGTDDTDEGANAGGTGEAGNAGGTVEAATPGGTGEAGDTAGTGDAGDASEASDAAVRVIAGYAHAGAPVPGLDSYTLPPVDVAAVVHHGPMSTISSAYQELAQWAESTGRTPATFSWREYYLEAAGDDQSDWIVEVQLEL